MTFPHHQDSLNFLAQEPSITLSASLPTLPFLTSYVLALSLLPEQTGLCILLCLCMEKAMAPHSSTLAWKIPWAEETGRLQSMGSWRVRHDWATSLSLFTFMHWRRKWQPTPVFLPGESPGMAEPGGLLSMGSHRVGHDWSDLAAAAAAAAFAYPLSLAWNILHNPSYGKITLTFLAQCKSPGIHRYLTLGWMASLLCSIHSIIIIIYLHMPFT